MYIYQMEVLDGGRRGCECEADGHWLRDPLIHRQTHDGVGEAVLPCTITDVVVHII